MKCNTVTFSSADGMSRSYPLDFLLEKEAIIATEINGETVDSVMGAKNQLWIPGMPAKYFMKDIVEIHFSEEEQVPSFDKFEDDGHDYTNRPNVSVKAENAYLVGQPITFEGYADDYDKEIVAVQFSLDYGETWTTYEVPDATSDNWVYWHFAYTPELPGSYYLKVRSVNIDGDSSPIAATHAFEVYS